LAMLANKENDVCIAMGIQQERFKLIGFVLWTNYILGREKF